MTQPTPLPEWKKLEAEIYEKWKREHPDVMHAYDSSNETPHEWWVRNYVHTRLLPFITEEKRKSYEEGYRHGGADSGRHLI